MSIYFEYLDKFPELPNSLIADRILENEEVEAKRKSIMRQLQRARKEGILDIVGRGYNGDSYKIHEGQYVFDFDGYTFDIPFDEIAAICRWYPDPYGMTQQEVCTRMRNYYGRDLTPDFLSRILKCLGVTKRSNPLAPHILNEWTEDQISDYYLQIKAEKFDFNNDIDHAQQWQKLYEKEAKRNIEMTGLIEAVKKRIEQDPLPHFDQRMMIAGQDSSSIVLVLSDWHVGQFIDLPQNKYSKEIFAERVMKLCREIGEYFDGFSRNVDEAHVVILGDMLDGPMGTMHAEQAFNQDLHHVDQVVWCAKGLACVIDAFAAMSGAPTVKVHSVGGNHGRVTANRDDDHIRFADQVTYAMANEMIPRDIEWIRHEAVFGSFTTKGTQVFLTHGDRAAKDIRDFVWINKHGDADHFVYCTGHLHAVMMEELASNILHIRGGAACGADPYASNLGKAARAAQVMFEVRGDGPRPITYLPMQ